MAWLKAAVSSVVLLASVAWIWSPRPVQAEEDETPPESGCTFKSNPSDFLNAQARARRDVFEHVRRLPKVRQATTVRLDAASLPRHNFIDEAIFGRLAADGIATASLSTDEEFVRRIYLDLTGRIPTVSDVRTFVADSSANKRNELIDRLLYSPEFIDKWSTWLGELVQNMERLASSARAPQIEGRNALHGYLRESVMNLKPIKSVVQELITGSGINYYHENGPANYAVLASTAMGPAQDTYDMMLTRTTGAFLGLAHYDCLLCHNGRGHLDGISLWGQGGLRVDAQRMAAHFSRMRLANPDPAARQYAHPLYNSTNVTDVTTGQYDLNTNFGNRPNRTPVGTARNLTPEYRDGTKPALNENWRAAYAQKLIADPMFGRNFANRLWKQFFGLGLVDPVDTLDPDRLDPKKAPPSPWTLQATHPELLEKLAQFFVEHDTDLRTYIRLLVESTAYQLSSSYEGEWKLEYVPLFARHYPRRLEGEEVHDAITKATGVPGRYTWPLVNGQTLERGAALPQSEPVVWAMQLPDPSEPRNNGAVREFMRAFYRGNRDTAQRLQSGSIPQQLSLMNDAFVTNRIKLTASAPLREIARITENEKLVEEVFLTFLSRKPTEWEMEKSTAHLVRANTPQRRNQAIEDLAWTCINKVDFLFSY